MAYADRPDTRAMTSPMRIVGMIAGLLMAVLVSAAAPRAADPSPPPPPANGARLSPEAAMPPAEVEAFVDGAVHQAMADDHIAGVTVSVVQNGQTVLKKGYGFASLVPYRAVDPDRTLFRIGSISKTFTWILVLKEVEAGRMRLDAPINLYLPESLRIPDQGFKTPVRVRDLMNHTPGFEDRVLGQLIERDYDRVRPLNTYLKDERPRRVREPETLVSYSNYGAGLAGAAVAEVTGKPFEALVESEITGPLGMSRTTFREAHPARSGMPAPLPPALAGDISEGYRWTPEAWRLRPFEYIGQIAPAAAGSSTASDMARYMLLILGEGSLDGAAVYGPLTARAFATALTRPAPPAPGWRHGLAEYALPGGFTGVGHDGGTLSFQSKMVVVPSLKLGVFVSTNTDTGQALADTLASRVVGRFYAPPPPPPPRGTLAMAEAARDFRGLYLTDRRAYGGLEGFVDRLSGSARVSVTDNGHLILARDGRVSRWTPVGDPGDGLFIGDDGVQRLVFQMRDGQALRFVSPGGEAAFERIPFWRRTMVLAALTVLTAIASLGTLVGVVLRARRDFRESSGQARAGVVMLTQAVLWPLAMILFAVWASGARDPAQRIYGWPGIPLILASSCALIASIMAVLTPLMLPTIWRGGRRVDSWTGGRKARFTLTAIIFLAYALLLGSSGALEPWSG
jgi:CubicO group peptidase (beta-lactamase class C family)